MAISRERSLKQWGMAWIALVLSLAMHVADEALNDFLPLYNQIVHDMRAQVAWFPFPTFTFRAWLSGLASLVIVLLALSPLVFRGHVWLRPIAYFLAIIMVANAIGHTAASLYWGIWAPGVYSSPVLFIAAAALLITTWRVQTQSIDEGGA